MRNRRRKLLVLAGLCAGTVFQLLPQGCPQFLLQGVVTAFDFCAVFNCEAGTFFDLCDPIALLVDCPGVIP